MNYLSLIILLFTIQSEAYSIPIIKLDKPKSSLAQKVFFTRNSLRRDPVDNQEVSAILSVGGCAGFFVANSENKYYVGTARHCYDYQLEKYCGSGEYAEYFSVRAEALPGVEFTKCNRVVVTSAQDDLAIIEVAIKGEPPEGILSKIRFLTLAAYNPEPWNRFKMIGYPGDDERGGALTITENCWDVTGYSYFAGSDSHTSDVGGNVSNALTGNKEIDVHIRAMNRRLRWHNCTTYGGNSGGPIILEDTNEVVGIPAGFIEKKKMLKETDAMVYEATSKFVERNYEAIYAAGVTVAYEPGASYSYHYELTQESIAKLKTKKKKK